MDAQTSTTISLSQDMPVTLPTGWMSASLRDISVRITKGSTPTSYGFSYTREGINFIKTENILGNGRIDNISDFIDHETDEYLGRSSLKANDVLFSIAGTIGRVGLVQSQDLPANTNQALAIIRCFWNEIEVKYLFYYLQSPSAQRQAAASTVGVGRANLSLQSLGDFQLPLAPKSEQQRIVAKIEELFTQLDAGVACLKRVQAGLQRYQAAVLKAACEGKLVPQDTSNEPASNLLTRILAERRAHWEEGQHAKGKDLQKARYEEPAPPDIEGLPELPEGWVWATIEQLQAHEPHSITDGPFGSNLKTSHYTEEGPRVIRLQNVGDGEFLNAEAHISEQHFAALSKHAVYAGDLVIAALGDSLPRACIIPDFVGPAIVKADCIRFKPHTILSTRYLNAALNSEVMKKAASRIVHGIGRPRLNQQEIKSLPAPLPPTAEQVRIAQEVERRLSVVQELQVIIEANLTRAERLRQAILRQAFEGKLVLQEPTDEPASTLLERLRGVRGPQAKAQVPSTNGKRHEPAAFPVHERGVDYVQATLSLDNPRE